MPLAIKHRKAAWLILLITLIIIISGCSSALTAKNQQSGMSYSKEKINQQLKSNQNVMKATWSPDNTKVVYIKTGKQERYGLDEAYLWKVGEKQAGLIRDIKPTTHGFNWSPDSRYFLISEKLGDGTVSSIVEAKSLREETYQIRSIGIPIWSPDSTMLAYGNEQHNYGVSWGSLEVYKLGAEEGEYIWKAKNNIYKVETWDEQGNIHYTEINDQGKEIKKLTKNIKPSISGVHLGDSMDLVRAALGNDYEETTFDKEIGHFPEEAYRWTYEEGYTIFFGAVSGEVLEINTTSPRAETNLGIKVGDTAEKVFAIYRPNYIEPESIHGGIIYGLFKVEGAAAMHFTFNLKEGQTPKDIKPQNKVERIILTYPEIMDDSF